MGKISSKSQMQQLHQNWVTAIQPPSTLSALNLYRTRLLQNITTQDYIQQYLLYFSNQDDYKNYLGHTEWRHNLQQNQPSLSYLPTIRALYNTSVSQLCTQAYSIAIYFDKIQLKLSDVNDLPYPQALYMLRVVLEGFKLLISRFGYFRVKEDMIFFNGEGEVFVWINPNISSVIPTRDETRLTHKYSNQQQLSQHQMLQDILSITEQNTDKESSNRYPILSQYIDKKLEHVPNSMNYNHNYNSTNIGSHHQPTNYRLGYQTSRPYAKNKYTFNSVLQVLKDYVHQFRIPVARRMDSIFNICGGREVDKIGQAKMVSGKRRSGSGNWGKKSSEGSQKDARSQIDRRQKEQLLIKQRKTAKDRNIQKIHLPIKQENDNETSIINDALPQTQNWHLNSSMFNGKFDQSAVTHMNHHTKFQERRTAGFKSPGIGQPNLLTTQISNSLQVYIGSQLDASNTITNRNLNTNLNNYNEKSNDAKYKKPNNIKSIYSGPAPIPQRSEQHNRNNTAVDPSSLNSSRNSMFAYNPNQKQQKQGIQIKTKTNNHSNHESQRNTANTIKIKNKGSMLQPNVEMKVKVYDQRRLATEGSDHKYQNVDGKRSKRQIIPPKNNGIHQYDRSRNSSIQQKHLYNSGNHLQLSHNLNVNNSQRVGPTYQPNIVVNSPPTLNYHRMGTHQHQHQHQQQQQHQQQPLSGSLRVHPIMNNYNISGMVTSRGHIAQQIKSKYQSPLSTLVEQRPQQRISRTTQPATGHNHRHPATQSTSLHRYHPTHTQLSNPNININTIKYMKAPQITITITTGNSQNSNINANRPRQQGTTVKPSSVNITGTRVYATVHRPQDLNNIQMQKYIREGGEVYGNSHGLSVNGREVRNIQGRGMVTSPREGEAYSKYYSQHEAHELDAEIAKDLAQINLQQY